MVSLEPTNASEQNLCKSSECPMESHGTPRSPNGCTYNQGIHVCIPILNLFGRKLFENTIQKPAQTGPAISSPIWIRFPGPSWRTPSPSTISPLPYWPSLSSGRVRFWEISPPKKGSNYFLGKRNAFWKPQIFGNFLSYNIDPNKTQLGLGHHPLTAKMIFLKKRAPTEFSMVKQPKKHPFLPKIPS